MVWKMCIKNLFVVTFKIGSSAQPANNVLQFQHYYNSVVTTLLFVNYNSDYVGFYGL